ncbi:hypothetical protein L2Y90_21725 [Burkholderia pyrrocinia]|uniref:hypothetical protein n=1 Tax=Burkholderia pyrrocinia TaxID=60550 RepID=UPI00215AFADD|nr:hypothetical protein [Burkholderia pyrrocinia]UVE69351.1 hypothetical protein L2Y90_21725 [Burkholderia pyrrocinia]
MSVGMVNRNCVVIEMGGQSDGANAKSQLADLDRQIGALVAQQLQKREGAVGGAREQMTAQSASGALASYMSQNGLSTVDPDKLYQLATNPPSGTPEDVSMAAKFMLDHPDDFKKIETHDAPDADGISGVSNFQWAAQGGLDASAAGDAKPATMALASGTPALAIAAETASAIGHAQAGVSASASAGPNVSADVKTEADATPGDLKDAGWKGAIDAMFSATSEAAKAQMAASTQAAPGTVAPGSTEWDSDDGDDV